MAKNKPAKNQPTVDDLKAPLLAAVGAADLALERVNEIVATLRERAGEAAPTPSRVEETRARVTKLQEDLPSQFVTCARSYSDELRSSPRATPTPRRPPTTTSSSGARPPGADP